MNKSIISVVIPVYNMEKYLNKCIESVINQTYRNLEILLIDDGSTDNSPGMCDEWAKKDNRIKVFHKTNGGLSDAKNYGIEHASGKFIGFVDSDDWIEENMYEELYKEAMDNNADIIICGRYLEFSNYKIIQSTSKKSIMTGKEAIIKMDSFGEFDMSSCDKMYRIELFDNIRFPYGKKCEDAYVTYKLFNNSKVIEYYPVCFYHYLQRNNSISKSKHLNKDLIYAAEEQIEFLKQNYQDISYIGTTNYVFAIKDIFEMAIDRNVKIDKELKKYKKDIKKYKKDVINNSYLNPKKKIAFIIFNDFFYLYLVLKKIKNIIKKNKLNG